MNKWYQLTTIIFCLLLALLVGCNAAPVKRGFRAHKRSNLQTQETLLVLAFGGLLVVVVYAVKRLAKCWVESDKAERRRAKQHGSNKKPRGSSLQFGILRQHPSQQQADPDEEALAAALDSFLKNFQYITKVSVKQHLFNRLPGATGDADGDAAGEASQYDVILVPWLAGVEPDLVDTEIRRCLHLYGIGSSSTTAEKRPSSSKLVLLLFHKRHPHDSVDLVSTETASCLDLLRYFSSVIDIIYDETLGVYQCTTNDKAMQKLLTGAR